MYSYLYHIDLKTEIPFILFNILNRIHHELFLTQIHLFIFEKNLQYFTCIFCVKV